GESLHLTASGGDVPAFTTNITAPTEVILQSPIWPSPAPTLDRSHDLTVTWSGGVSPDTVEVWIARRDVVTCHLPATDGRGVVPAAALQHLQGGQGSLVLRTYNEVHGSGPHLDVGVHLETTGRMAGQNNLGDGDVAMENFTVP